MRVIPKVPVKGRVVHHDHRRIISVGLSEEMRLIFTDGRLDALVEDPDRGISYIATAKVRSNVMYIYVPKKLWQFYEKGAPVKAMITPLIIHREG